MMIEYLPPSIAEEIYEEARDMQEKSNVGCHASVLAIQIHPFDDFKDLFLPYQLAQAYEWVLDEIRNKVKMFKGTPIRDFSTGLLAVFGIPKALKDHEDMALLCAIDGRRTIPRRLAESGMKELTNVKISFAVTSGFTWFGQMMSKSITDIHIAGDPVMEVAKLIGLSEEGQIVTGESLKERVKNLAPFTTRDVTSLSDSLQPMSIIEIHEV